MATLSLAARALIILGATLALVRHEPRRVITAAGARVSRHCWCNRSSLCPNIRIYAPRPVYVAPPVARRAPVLDGRLSGHHAAAKGRPS